MKTLDIVTLATNPNGVSLKFVVSIENLFEVRLVPQVFRIGDAILYDEAKFHAILVWHEDVGLIRENLMEDLYDVEELADFRGVTQEVWVDDSGFVRFWIPGDGIYSDIIGGRNVSYHSRKPEFWMWQTGEGFLGIKATKGDEVFLGGQLPRIDGVNFGISAIQDTVAKTITFTADVVINEGRSTED